MNNLKWWIVGIIIFVLGFIEGYYRGTKAVVKIVTDICTREEVNNVTKPDLKMVESE